MSERIQQVAHFETGGPPLEALLDGLPCRSVSLPSNNDIDHIDDDAAHVFHIERGWILAYRLTSDGSRSISHFYLPGDIVGLSTLPIVRPRHRLLTRTAVRMICYDRRDIIDRMRESPSLLAFSITVAARELAFLTDMRHANNRAQARQRMAQFLMHVLSRLSRANPSTKDQIDIPLTQQDIGDYLGLSVVHTNKVLRWFEETGVISRQGRRYTILSGDHLREICAYDEQLADIDDFWFETHTTNRTYTRNLVRT